MTMIHDYDGDLEYIKIHAGNYMFKVNNRNTRTRCEICSRLTIKTQEQHHWHKYITSKHKHIYF